MAFARDGGEVSGNVGSDRLPRLCESEADTQGLGWRVVGHMNAMGRPALSVRVEGVVAMTCQRCLQPVEVPIDVDVELELSESLREIETADDDVDRALASRAMDVIALVEDEVLLELPMSPRHESCEPAQTADGAADQAGAERVSPFAALASRRR